MDLLDVLRANKGTVSSALGKELGKEVIDGNHLILDEAIKLTSYNIEIKKDKNIRAGAAKIVETVAEKKPGMVSDNLNKLLPAFEADEPQTRWMIMQVFGYCAKLNEGTAKLGIMYARRFLKEKHKSGVCLLGSVDLFLGAIGALSRRNTEEVLPIIKESAENCIKNEHDWILEAFMKIIPFLNNMEIENIMPFVAESFNTGKKATQKRVEKLYIMIQ